MLHYRLRAKFTFPALQGLGRVRNVGRVSHLSNASLPVNDLTTRGY